MCNVGYDGKISNLKAKAKNVSVSICSYLFNTVINY